MKKVISAEALKMLQNEDSVLIDVRTPEEWEANAAPSLNSRDVVFLSLMTLPDMSMTPGFIEDFIALQIEPDQKLFFVCKAGGRSGYAAEICSGLGYECYNITDGIDALISAIMASPSLQGGA